jgi:hypothetical protein
MHCLLALELWNGPGKDKKMSRKEAMHGVQNHQPSQSDSLDDSRAQSGMFPPLPSATNTTRNSGQGYDYSLKVSGSGAPQGDFDSFGPAPANSALAGGSFW